MENIWAPPVRGRRYVRTTMVCEGKFKSRWFDEYDRIADPCGYEEPPGTPEKDKGYECPRCGGALRRQMVEATYLDLVEQWVEQVYMKRPK